MKNKMTKITLRALVAREALKDHVRNALLDCSGLHVTVEEGGHTALAIALLAIFAVFTTGFLVNTFDPQLKTQVMNLFTSGSAN